MKEIDAYIKPHKLTDVTLALHHAEGFTGRSVSDVKGLGRGLAQNAPHSIREDLTDYIPHVKIEIPHVKIEIVCHDELVDEIVETIRKAAHTR